MNTPVSTPVLNTMIPSQMTPAQQNALAKKYMPLIHKITNQWVGKSNDSEDDLFGYAIEGFADAINTYDPAKANGQTFQQYAAFRIKYFIQNGINEYSRVIKISAYNQGKIADGEKEAVTTTSLDMNYDGEDCYTDHCIAIGVEDSDPSVEGSTMKSLYDCIDKNFSERDANILYMRFGINGRKQIECKEICKIYNLTGQRVSAILKKMYDFIRTQKELSKTLMEMLTSI